MIGDATIENKKAVRKQKLLLKSGFCRPCFSRTNNLFPVNKLYQQKIFKSNVTLES